MSKIRAFAVDFALMFVAFLAGRLIARYLFSRQLELSSFDLAETALIAAFVAIVRLFICRKGRS